MIFPPLSEGFTVLCLCFSRAVNASSPPFVTLCVVPWLSAGSSFNSFVTNFRNISMYGVFSVEGYFVLQHFRSVKEPSPGVFLYIHVFCSTLCIGFVPFTPAHSVHRCHTQHYTMNTAVILTALYSIVHHAAFYHNAYSCHTM